MPGSPEIQLGPWAPSQVDLSSFPPLPFPLGLPLDWVFCPVKGFGTLEGLLGALGVQSLCGFLPFEEDLLHQPMEAGDCVGERAEGNLPSSFYGRPEVCAVWGVWFYPDQSARIHLPCPYRTLQRMKPSPNRLWGLIGRPSASFAHWSTW